MGDVTDAKGHAGVVKEIQIFFTILATVDSKTVLVPNGLLATYTLISYPTQPACRVDWTIGIAYGDDLDKAYEVVNKRIAADNRIVKAPESFVALSALADSGANIVVRAWVNAPDYWSVFFKMNEEVYRTFGKEGLLIPYPQMDVHVRKVG